jgi:hypothetical protein
VQEGKRTLSLCLCLSLSLSVPLSLSLSFCVFPIWEQPATRLSSEFQLSSNHKWLSLTQREGSIWAGSGGSRKPGTQSHSLTPGRQGPSLTPSCTPLRWSAAVDTVNRLGLGRRRELGTLRTQSLDFKVIVITARFKIQGEFAGNLNPASRWQITAFLIVLGWVPSATSHPAPELTTQPHAPGLHGKAGMWTSQGLEGQVWEERAPMGAASYPLP